MTEKIVESKINDVMFISDSMIEADEKETAENMQKLLTGKDAQQDPYSEKWLDQTKSLTATNGNNQADGINPAWLLYPWEDLYAASLTPKGAYITRVSTRIAFHQGWRFVTADGKNGELSSNLNERFYKINKRYKLKQTFMQMTRTAKIFGRSLVFKQLNPYKKPKDQLFLRVAAIDRNEINYDAQGYPQSYDVLVKQGHTFVTLHIPASDAVLCVWDQDELGNLYEGIPECAPIIPTLLRDEGISEEYGKTIEERGVGIVDILDKQAKTQNDLKAARKNFMLGKDRVFVHSDRYEVKVTNGVAVNYDYDTTKGRYTKDASSGTGYPGMAMEGVQQGAVTGSETDQDNRAQMYRVTQELVEDAMREVYCMLDPSLSDIEFEFKWEFEVKQDSAKKAQVFSMYASSIQAIPDLVTVNQALQLLEFPKLDDKTGDFTLSEFMALNQSVMNSMNQPELPVMPDETHTTPEEPTSERETKLQIASRLAKTGDSYNNINLILRKIFGSGISNDVIQQLKKKD